VYEIDLSGNRQSPDFALIGELASDTVWFFRLDRNRVFIAHRFHQTPDTGESRFDTVWDFVEKKCATWYVPGKYAPMIGCVSPFKTFRTRGS